MERHTPEEELVLPDLTGCAAYSAVRLRPPIPSMTHLSTIALFLFLALPFQDPAEPKPVPKTEIPQAIWTQMDNVAHQLAKSGREKEYKHFMDALTELGMPEKEFGKLKTACIGELQKVTKVLESVPDATKRIKAATRQIAVLVEKAPDEEKQRVARILLRLDDSLEEAHKIMGHELVGKVWMSAEEKETRVHRGEILEAMDKAGKLEIDVESGTSDDEQLTKWNGQPGCFVKYGTWVWQSCLSEEKTKRIVVEVMRAEALSSWLRGKELSAPKKPGTGAGRTFYMLDTRPKYDASVEWNFDEKNITEEEYKAFKGQDIGGYNNKKGTIYKHGHAEGEFESVFFVALNTMPSNLHLTSLQAGHLNWVCLAMIGSPIPTFVWKNKDSGPPAGETYVDNPAERKLREEKYQLAQAGVRGCRSWVAFLAERYEDPKWENTFVDELGKIRGEDLLKATAVAEYIHELNILPDLIKKLNLAKRSDKTYAAMGKALGMPVSEFESRWRAWIIPKNGGIAQEVDKVTNTGFASDELEALKYLNQLRRKAFEGRLREVTDLKLERELCDGVQKHAAYLALNPEQANAWPDAHEEYRDKEGYTPEGHWGGTHADVGPIGKGPTDAIDGWMSTFYHRVPMLLPELRRIGWGQAGPFACIDIGSFVVPPEGEWTVVWPADGMKDVAINFANGGKELPNPVLQDPEQNFGYPVTLQLGNTKPDAPSPQISMKLLDGKNEVPCWFSSPDKPSNPDVVEKNAWCLIPKGKLKPGTTYTVMAEWYLTGNKITWTFKTGN